MPNTRKKAAAAPPGLAGDGRPPPAPAGRVSLGFLALGVLTLGLPAGCASLSHPPPVTSEVPPEVEARVFGRWICGAELPQGRPTSTFELLRHLGPGKAWDLEVDEDGLAALQVVGHHGRARQGCWAELTPGELATLESVARDSGICGRPEDPRATEPHNAFDVDLHLAGATCTKHFGATALLRAPQGQRFAGGTQRVLNDVAGGSFRRMEEVVTSMRPASARPRARPLPPNVAAVPGRLTCAKERPTIYEPGDPWLLQYEFQKGFLWRRGLEVSSRGAVGIEFASLQNGARYACTGQLTAKELADLRDVLATSKPCELTGPPPRGRDDHGYISVNRAALARLAPAGEGGDRDQKPLADCRYDAIREGDLRATANGRRFDDHLTSLVGDLAGPGGVDPFDPERGVLVDRKAPARPGKGVARPRQARASSGSGAGATFER